MIYSLNTRSIILILLLFVVIREHKAQDPAAGVVVAEVRCLNDSSHTYSLYLPTKYYDNNEDQFPVIYAFDAAARGTMAVELFSQAAEKFGYIIAGSNISQNGPWAPILNAAETMMKDVEQKFRIDPARRYTAGFSGGARVATSLAVLYGTFEGVIGCGAGFSPNYPPNFDLHPCYIGIVGNRDFNYQEMMRLDEWLSKFDIDHYIYEFAGGHEWPPMEVLTNAVTWLEFRAMENDLIWTDYSLREEFYEDRLNLVNTFMKQGNTYSAYLEAVELKSYLHGIRRLDDVDLIINTLKSDEEVRHQMLRRKQILEEERTYYKEYLEAFNSYQLNLENSMTQAKPISYWKEQLKIAQSKTDVGKDMYEVLLGRRMIDFIWRTAYQQYESIQGTEYQILSKYYLDIWITVQPDAISPYFFLARYYTSMGKYSKAMTYLHEAVDRGLDDPALIEGDTVLVRLTTLPEYQTVAARIGN
jgi:hypothetical protein